MRLRLAVVTPPAPGAIATALLERLARDPRLDVVLVVDDSAPAHPAARTLDPDRHGLADTIAQRLFDLAHEPREEDDAASVARRTDVALHHVGAVDRDLTVDALRALHPQLLVVVGSATPPAELLNEPAHGTLAVGGALAAVGGALAFAVGLHRLEADGMCQPALAATLIAIEAGETRASLRIKAELAGAELCHEVLRRIAGDVRGGRPRIARREPGVTATDAPAPLEVALDRLKPVLVHRARVMDSVWPRRSWAVKLRLAAQYASVLPLLQHTRARLVRERRAPVSIFFYHLVANRPLNHMCLPLEAFAAQVAFLRRYFPVVSLDQAVERVASGKNDDVCAALTFDDGYRDNAWAIQYLSYLGVPASFFVSMGHVLDGSGFAHDHEKGFHGAPPMTETDVRKLTSEGFLVGSHALHHEDFGRIDEPTADRVLRESRELVAKVAGQAPEHFSFPRGQRGANITPAAYRLATKYYRYVYSAYGGYNLPSPERRHFVRLGTPVDVLELAMTMDGYRGLRDCLRGDAWGVRTSELPPYMESAA
ncbi:MAG TPA: polysaccharide deacetylase family protein [Methylomirabilota bacterium]|jgi:peptidoglycan/xylan/chitin deacetylase (PgdA/CDA1 family)|nr:polysaccharide deacetylase family protein [Methylomirabilota bacterium]